MSDANTPFVRNRLFPVAIALWFAALLGLGSWLVPPSSWEGVVSLLGIDRAVPQARAPLGLNARLLISAVAAVIGLLTGLALGRWLQARRRREDAELEDEWDHREPEFGTSEPADAEFEQLPPIDSREDDFPQARGQDDADRLVAGLPTFEREALGGGDREDDDEIETGEWIEEDLVHPRAGPIFDEEIMDGEFDEVDDVAAPSGQDASSRPDAMDVEVAPEDSFPARAAEDLADLSLVELIDRFEASLVRARAGGLTQRVRDPAPPSPVVPFPAATDSRSADPGKTLREALQKLDEARSGNP